MEPTWVAIILGAFYFLHNRRLVHQNARLTCKHKLTTLKEYIQQARDASRTSQTGSIPFYDKMVRRGELQCVTSA